MNHCKTMFMLSVCLLSWSSALLASPEPLRLNELYDQDKKLFLTDSLNRKWRCYTGSSNLPLQCRLAAASDFAPVEKKN